jgi:hypothetical protein
MSYRVLALLPLAACGSIPDVLVIEAVQGDDVLSTLEPQEVEETAFEEDLPADVTFRIEFDETMKLTSAREHIWIEDQEEGELPVQVDARLQMLTVEPEETLEGGQNHTLVIESAIQDNGGTSMLSGYRVVFFTEEAQED